MTYGTLKAADGRVNKISKMTCFKYLFTNCCLRFRNRHPSLRNSSGRRSSLNSSEWDGDGSSMQSSSQIPHGRSSSTRSRPRESYRALEEDDALLTSTPRTDAETGECSARKLGKSSVPLISVIDCSEPVLEEKTEEVSDTVSFGKPDSDVEDVPVPVNSKRNGIPFIALKDKEEQEFIKDDLSEKDNQLTKDNDVEQLPAYQSQSHLSTSTELVQDVSMADVNSASTEDENYDSVKVSGDITFGLSYNYKTGALEVDIKNCRNLSAVDTKKNRSDPYVKGYLLPDRSKTGKKKTKVKKNTLNPLFDEVLKFPVTIGELETRTLWLSVWHNQFGRNNFLGELMLPLAHGTIENYGYKRHALNERLEKHSSSLKYNGDIALSLTFLALDSKSPNTTGELHVLVKEAKNLIPTSANGTSNPFCKSYLLPEKNKTSKQKTVTVKKNCNPNWNHTFVYPDVTLADLRERCLELTIWSRDKMSSNHFLGGVRLSLGGGTYQGRNVEWKDSAGEEVNLWNAMLHKPDVCVEGTLLLRTQMQRPQI